MMAVYKFKPVLATENLGVITPDFSGPVFKGSGPDDYLCPKCDRVLAKSVTLSDLSRMLNMAIRCYDCKQVSKL